MKTCVRRIGGVLILLAAVARVSAQDAPDSRPTRARVFAASSFIAFGDWGVSKELRSNQLAVRDAMRRYVTEHRTDFFVLLGDNFYPNGVESKDDPQFLEKFERIYTGVEFDRRFFVTPGNHDYRGDVLAQRRYGDRNPKWWMPHGPASHPHGGTLERPCVELFNIDTERLLASRADRAKDLEVLRVLLRDSRAVWKVAYGHRPLFSDGGHADAQKLIGILAPLFVKYGVDFYFSGHDHNMQLIQNRDGLDRDFTLYAVAGSGGQLSLTMKPSKASLFQRRALGFAAFRAGETWADIEFRDQEGKVLFRGRVRRDDPEKKVEILKQTAADAQTTGIPSADDDD